MQNSRSLKEAFDLFLRPHIPEHLHDIKLRARENQKLTVKAHLIG